MVNEYSCWFGLYEASVTAHLGNLFCSPKLEERNTFEQVYVGPEDLSTLAEYTPQRFQYFFAGRLTLIYLARIRQEQDGWTTECP